MTGRGVPSPVPGVGLPLAVQCVGARCQNKRATDSKPFLDALVKDPNAKGPRFQCPNQEEGKKSECPTQGFLYPRTPRAPAGEDFDPKVDFHFHQGIDLMGKDGKHDIVAVIGGEVVHANLEYDKSYDGYGRSVVIKGEDNRYYLYAHCAWFKDGIEQGKTVKTGQAIAVVGCTGFDSPEDAIDEIKHCDALKAAVAAGKEPPAPPEVKKKDRKGKEYLKKWMPPHLHFEVSETPYPKSKARERRPELPYGREQRLDPLKVLEELANAAPVIQPPRLVFPDGTAVDPEGVEKTHDKVERNPVGGYFPVSSANFWHGGVHLYGKLGEPVRAPFDGTIIAVRHDEDFHTANQYFGSVNFVLMQHEIPRAIAERLAPAPPKPQQGGSSKASGNDASAGGTSKAERAEPKKAIKVGKGCDNPPEYVLEVKRLLHGYPHHEPREDGTRRPYYDGSDEELSSDKPDDKLYQAIQEFQEYFFPLLDQSRPLPSKRPRKANGKVEINPDGYTMAELRRRAQGDAPPVPPPKPPPQPGTEQPSAEPSAGAAEEQKDVETIFSLFMHLESAPLDAARGQQVPWLSRARSKDEQAAEAERQKERDAERKEASHRMKGDVGPAGARGMENLEPDVRWVQTRLARFGDFAGPVDGLPSDALCAAISTFQEKHPLRDGPKNRDGTPRTKPDGVVNCNKRTSDYLRRTKAELGLEDEPPPELSAAFLDEVRKRHEDDTTCVVSDLSIPVQAGEVIGTLGDGGVNDGVLLPPRLHWEIFSEKPLMPSWAQIDDRSDDLKMDASTDVFKAIEHMELDADEKTLSEGEVRKFYNSGYAANFRELMCRFVSEWAHTRDAYEKAYAGLGDQLASYTADATKPYLWWEQARSVLPGSPKVWHYNPIAFLAEYARASGAYVGELTVEVKFRGQTPVVGVLVELSRAGQVLSELATDENGCARFVSLGPGTYTASVREGGVQAKAMLAAAQSELVTLVLE